uniref:Uncharacterized protein n=1 Tax=Anopheles funestus TaxID=62324 RepID=A0A182RUM8_ANOFN
MKFPLPSISTLQKNAQKINLKQGILDDIMEFVVEKIIEYDPAADEILGPYNNIQVVVARGLFKNRKQPIFIGFDQKMTDEIILSIIGQLYDKGINVVAVVSNNYQNNVGCWKNLGAHDYTRPFFCTSSYIKKHGPRMLKLTGNWLVDHGFMYDDKQITAKPLWKLLHARAEAEMTPIFKIN